MKAYLKIPFEEKDSAKVIAKNSRVALFYTGMGSLWEFNGSLLPQELNRYLVEIVEESPPTNKILKPQQNYSHIIDLPFMMRMQIAGSGLKYSGENKAYIYNGVSVPSQFKDFVSNPYSYEAWIEKELNGHFRNDILEQYAKEDIIIARDYQLAAKKEIMQAYKNNLGGFLLADEVGLGKTISAGIFAQEKDFETILIVTTLAAVAHWRKTFLKMLFPNKEIVVINYDRLQKLFEFNENAYKTKAKSKKTKNKRVAKSGIAPEFDLVVLDESHKLRNNTTMRSKLAAKIVDNADFTLYMSATAGQNPLELSYLAPLLAKITGQSVKSMVEFEQWCKSMDMGVSRGDYGKWLWDGSQQSIDKIHGMLFKGKVRAALRRTPSDLVGYPEISRALTPLDMTSEEIVAYNLVWEEFKGVMQNTKNKKPKKGEDNVLVAKLRLRQKASFLKIPYTVEYIEDMLDNGHQVAVSVAFKDTLHEIVSRLAKKKISVSLIYGDINPLEKEEQRIKFQTGENKVVIFTVEEAISLHQGEYNDVPRTMLIHDLRWSAISMSQLEGRTHRDGKFSQIYWLYFGNTIEEEIAKIVLSRVISMKSMVGDDTEVLREIEKVLLKNISN